MSFKWSKEWEEQLNYFAKNVPEDEDILIDLLELPNGVNDKRVIKAMARCVGYEIYGIEQTLLNEISRFDYKIYFETIFEIIDEFFDITDNYEIAILLLHQGTRMIFSNEEINNIINIAKEKLTHQQMERLAYGIEYHIMDDYKSYIKNNNQNYIKIDKIYNDLYQFFIKEKRECN